MAFRIKNGKLQAYFKYQGRQYCKIVSTKREGKVWEIKKRGELEQAGARTPSLMFSVVSATYLDDCKARVQPITLQEKYRHLTEFAEFVGHDFPAEELDIGTAKAFIAHIQNVYGTGSVVVQPYSDPTAISIHSFLVLRAERLQRKQKI